MLYIYILQIYTFETAKKNKSWQQIPKLQTQTKQDHMNLIFGIILS